MCQSRLKLTLTRPFPNSESHNGFCTYGTLHDGKISKEEMASVAAQIENAVPWIYVARFDVLRDRTH